MLTSWQNNFVGVIPFPGVEGSVNELIRTHLEKRKQSITIPKTLQRAKKLPKTVQMAEKVRGSVDRKSPSNPAHWALALSETGPQLGPGRSHSVPITPFLCFKLRHTMWGDPPKTRFWGVAPRMPSLAWLIIFWCCFFFAIYSIMLKGSPMFVRLSISTNHRQGIIGF